MPLTRLWTYTRLAAARYTEHRLEFAASLGVMTLGLWLVFTSTPLSYAFLTTLAPLWVWGVALLVVGFTSRLGILRQDVRLRRIGMLGIFFCRLALLGAVAYGTHWTSTTIPEHISWLIVCVWGYFRAGRA